MMRLNDAYRFAMRKIKQHKVRNGLSVIGVALGLIIMLVIILGTTGVLNVGNAIFQDSLKDRFFSVDFTAQKEADLNAYKEIAGPYNPIAYYTSQDAQDMYEFGGLPEMDEDLKDHLNVKSMNEIFVRDFLFEGASFADQGDGVIPVVIPREWLTLREGITSDDEQQSYEKGQELMHEYMGKEVNLYRYGFDDATGQMKTEGEETGVTIRIVGFVGSGLFDNIGLSQSIVMPDWAMADEDVAALFEPTTPYVDEATALVNKRLTIFTEFANDVDRMKFTNDRVKVSIENPHNTAIVDDVTVVESGGPMSIPQPLMNRYEFFEGFIKVARGVGMGLGGFLLFIAMCFILVNVSKAVADSRKEIGVFRAVGASGWDIQKIYFAFAGILVTMGFVSALIVSLVVNALASQKWGGDLFYRLMNIGSTAAVHKPTFLFIGVNPGPILLLYAIVVVAALAAAAIPAFRASRIDPVVALKD